MNPLDYCPKCKRSAVVKGNTIVDVDGAHQITLSCDNRHEWSVKSESPVLEWLGEYDVYGKLIVDEKKEDNADDKE